MTKHTAAHNGRLNNVPHINPTKTFSSYSINNHSIQTGYVSLSTIIYVNVYKNYKLNSSNVK